MASSNPLAIHRWGLVVGVTLQRNASLIVQRQRSFGGITRAAHLAFAEILRRRSIHGSLARLLATSEEQDSSNSEQHDDGSDDEDDHAAVVAGEAEPGDGVHET